MHINVLVLCMSTSPAAGFVASSLAGARRRVVLALADVEIIEESSDFSAAATHFVDSFWADKATTRTLTREQKRKLQREQLDEFRRRYGRVSARRRSALFVVRDSSNQVLGCAGVEIEEAVDPVPIMSNLAVAASGRRRGLAKRLVRECEKKSRDWGLSQLALVVEERNTKARKLYAKLGYRVVQREKRSSTLLPLPDGRIVSETTTALTMRRNLLLPPIDPVALSLGSLGALAFGTLRNTRFIDPLRAFLASLFAHLLKWFPGLPP